MRSLGSPSRTRIAIVAGVALVVILVLVVVLRGGDDEDLRIVRGAPDAGFPLRGAGAGDADAIRAAADAWVRKARRDGDDWADDTSLEVTVLWAGPLERDTDGVVLVSDRSAAVLQRLRGRDYWQVDDAVTNDADDPVVVAGAGAVLVRQGTRSSFLPGEARGRRSAAVRQDDGLWHRGSTDLATGALLLPDGLRSALSSATPDLPPVGVFLPGSVVAGGVRTPALRELSPRLLRRLSLDATDLSARGERSGPALMSAQRLIAAAGAAGAVRREGAERPRPRALPRIDLVAEEILPPLGPVVVLSASPSTLGARSDDRRPTLVAAAGGSTVAGRDDAVTAIPLGGSADGARAGDGLRADEGPALGAAYVRREVRDEDATSSTDEEEPRVEGPFLLVAGDEDVAAVEVRAGRRTLRVPVPLGLVRADWLPSPGPRERTTVDVSILGRTGAGAAVVPALSGAEPATVEARE